MQLYIRATDNSDFTGLGNLKFKNPPFHLDMGSLRYQGTLGIFGAREGHIFSFFFYEGLHNVCNKDKIGQICACLAPMVEKNENFP